MNGHMVSTGDSQDAMKGQEAVISDMKRELARRDAVKREDDDTIKDLKEKVSVLMSTVERLDKVISGHETQYKELQNDFDNVVKHSKSQETFMAKSQSKFEVLEEDHYQLDQEHSKLADALKELEEQLEEEVVLKEQAQYELTVSLQSSQELMENLREAAAKVEEYEVRLAVVERRPEQDSEEGAQKNKNVETEVMSHERYAALLKRREDELAQREQNLVCRYDTQLLMKDQEITRLNGEVAILKSSSRSAKSLAPVAPTSDKLAASVREGLEAKVRMEERERYEAQLCEQNSSSEYILNEQKRHYEGLLKEEAKTLKATQEIAKMRLKACEDKMASMEESHIVQLENMKQERVKALDIQKKEVKAKCKGQFDAQVSKYLEHMNSLQSKYMEAMKELQKKEDASKLTLMTALEKQKIEKYDDIAVNAAVDAAVDKKLQIVMASHMQQLDLARRENAEEHRKEIDIIQRSHASTLAHLQDELLEKSKEKDKQILELVKSNVQKVEDAQRATQEGHAVELAEIKRQHATVITVLEKGNQEHVSSLKARHAKTVQGIEKIHNTTIAKMEKRHSEEVSQARDSVKHVVNGTITSDADHQNILAETKAAHKKEMEALRARHVKTVQGMEQVHNSTIAKMEKRHSESLDSISRGPSASLMPRYSSMKSMKFRSISESSELDATSQSETEAKLREQVAVSKTYIESIKAKHSKTVQGMEKIHNATIAKIETRHAEALAAATLGVADKLAEQQGEHDRHLEMRDSALQQEIEDYTHKTDQMYIDAMSNMRHGYEEKIAKLMETISLISANACEEDSAVSIYPPDATAGVSNEVRKSVLIYLRQHVR